MARYLSQFEERSRGALWTTREMAIHLLGDILELVAECKRSCHKCDKGDYWLAEVERKVREMLEGDDIRI